MAKFYMFFGTQAYEFERPEISKTPGTAKIDKKIYSVLIRPFSKGGENMDFLIKQNDTIPYLEAQLIDANGNPINLDMCSVTFHMEDMYGKKKIIRKATIIDAEQGNVRIEWGKGETDIAGTMRCEFEIIFTDDSILTVPNDGYFTITIVPELA